MIFKVINYKGQQAVKLVEDDEYLPMLEIVGDTLEINNIRLSKLESLSESVNNKLNYIKSFIDSLDIILQLTIGMVLVKYFIGLL